MCWERVVERGNVVLWRMRNKVAGPVYSVTVNEEAPLAPRYVTLAEAAEAVGLLVSDLARALAAAELQARAGMHSARVAEARARNAMSHVIEATLAAIERCNEVPSC